MLPLLVVALALLILYLGQYGSDLRAARALAPEVDWFRIPIKRSLAAFLALMLVPPLFVAYIGDWLTLPEWPWLWVVSIILSALISYTWYRYLAWLDVFEPEQRRAMLFVVLFSVILTYFVPDLYRLVESVTAWEINGEFLNDLLYSIVVIGGLEESAKLIPYLVLLLFTKRINEPYDHLLYLSLSALGFAFVENMHYLHRSDLFAVTGRALYASVAHMCFSSFIGYGVARALQRGRGHAIVVGMLMFLVACAAHGLYDVWLVAPGRPTFFTTIFFLGTIQLWVIMKNNLINLSPYAEPHRKLRSTMFRYRIVNAMLAIYMLAFLMVYLLHGTDTAWEFYSGQWVRMMVMLLILAISFGSYRVIPGYVARLGLSSNPIRWFLPVSGSGEDLSGGRVRVDIPTRNWRNIDLPELRRALPVMGLLERRVVLGDDKDWYLFRPERQLDLGAGLEALFLMKLDADVDTIPSNAYVRMILCRFQGTPRIVNGQVQGGTVVFGPRVFAQLIKPIHQGAGSGSGLSALGGHGLS